MIKNKVKIIVSVILLLTIVVCTYNNFTNKNEEIVLNKKTETKTGTTSLSMMYETEAGSGNYEESSESAWPSEGYTFNETLSKCEQGGILTWNETEHKVYLSTNKSDKCYVYFDKLPDGMLLADYIKGLYTTDGENGLYLHDADLANGANDGSYRYAGANPNNFVCFGSDATPCPDDNLYRIIGVFNDQIKLIKATGYGQYNSGLWNADSFLDTEAYTALNDTFYNSLPDNYRKTIAAHNWINGELQINSSIVTTVLNQNNNVMLLAVDSEWVCQISWQTAKQWYIAESAISNVLQYKIGTMSISELRYSADPNNWSKEDFDINSWMFNRENEEFYLYHNFLDVGNSRNYRISANGHLYMNSSACSDCDFDTYTIRPAFYLASNTSFAGGTGSEIDPIRIV